MGTKTDNSAYYIGFATIITSIILFVTSLGFPAFNFPLRGDSPSGLETLLWGWSGLIFLGEPYGGIGYSAWLANLFLIPIWIGLVLPRKSAVGHLAMTIIAFGFASSALALKELAVDEAGHTVAFKSMGLGFYLWLSSFVICVIGYLALIARAKFISNNAMKNQ